jgi:hypothetical protein
MERHSVDEADAFEMLRDHSRWANTRLADVAAVVVDGHRLLPKQPDISPTALHDGAETARVNEDLP